MSSAIDYSWIRTKTIELHRLSHMDDIFTFFYDETNNSRVFRLTEKGLNTPKCQDFVLGGLLYCGLEKELDVESLKGSLRLQPSMNEIKKKHIIPGTTFPECIESPRLEVLLRWIISNDLFIHFTALNNLYYGVVDIIDSLVAGIGQDQYSMTDNMLLKNVLYTYANRDIDLIHRIFIQYEYPNIDKDNISSFCKALQQWIARINTEDEIEARALVEIAFLLKQSESAEELVFLMDNQSKKLVDGYEDIYMTPIYMFPNSKHIFDEEYEIEGKIEATPIALFGNTLKNYTFVNSKDNVMIQLSDVVVGLIGKLMQYANETDALKIIEQMNSISDQQKHNLRLLKTLLYGSDRYCKAFVHFIIPAIEQEKINLILTTDF